MNRLDSELKSILSNHKSDVPHDSWENIKDGLVEEGASRFLLFYWMTGLLIIALVGLLAFNYINGNAIENSDVASENLLDNALLDENSYLVPLETDMLRFDEKNKDEVNNLVITNSSFKNGAKIDVVDSSFIKNLKAIKEYKK